MFVWGPVGIFWDDKNYSVHILIIYSYNNQIVTFQYSKFYYM